MENYFDLGTHTRPVTTASPHAQLWFDRGLNWLYGFNHEEAVTCFKTAAQFDPECAMARWGIALAAGPFYNYAWCDHSQDEAVEVTRICFDAAQHAQTLARKNSTDTERALIAALTARYPQNRPAGCIETFNRWDDAYANAMRAVFRQFPDDLDVTALFVEAAMTRTPWKLWDYTTGEPMPRADTLEVLEITENALKRIRDRGLPHHPALLHLHIHLVEMSEHPERGLPSAKALEMLCPDAGHLNHMPGHIYALTGDYEAAVRVSADAIKADNLYLAYAGADNFYTTARCHDFHLMMYACMMLGRYEPALEAANSIRCALTPERLGVQRPQMAVSMEGYYSMFVHVLVRFGKWERIIETPMPPCPVLYCVSTAMHRYARCIAFAALARFEEAERALAAFEQTYAAIPPARRFFNNPAREILDVARAMARGELAYHKGDPDRGFRYLREAVRACDTLYYNEPWAWMHPPRHALGALLLEQGHSKEAEAVFRADLGPTPGLYPQTAPHHRAEAGSGVPRSSKKISRPRCTLSPNNIWGLHGLVECLERNGKQSEADALRPHLQKALAASDGSVTSSCCCRTVLPEKFTRRL